MAIETRPLHPHVGAEMTGIDVRNPLTPAEVAAVDAGMDKHAVLVLPRQDITDEQQIEFTRNFGPLQNGANATLRRPELRLDPAFADVSNLGKNGEKLARDDRRRANKPIGFPPAAQRSVSRPASGGERVGGAGGYSAFLSGG